MVLRHREGDRDLDQAAAWLRAASPESLSEAARRRILREAFHAAPTALPRIAWGRRLFAGGLPIALICLLAFVLADRTGGGDAPLRILAAKAGDEVVFSMPGGKSHYTVYKCNIASNLGESNRIPVKANSFRDTVDDESGLVFYRIE